MFLLAGRLDWLGGWLVTALFIGSQAAQWLLIAPRYPDLLVERSRVGAGVERRDIPFAMGMAYGPLIAMLAAGLEVRLNGLPDPLLVVVATGVIVSAMGISITLAAMLANRYFSPVVRIQDDRGHEVADTGPYGRVRHPGYVGAILFYIGLPAVMSSWWVAIVMAVTAAITVARTARDDAYLQEHLPGYADYAGHVRWRLLPGVW
jgi:protein-S-isoprenylcysteine O-methyltransferase Ste14